VGTYYSRLITFHVRFFLQYVTTRPSRNKLTPVNPQNPVAREKAQKVENSAPKSARLRPKLSCSARGVMLIIILSELGCSHTHICLWFYCRCSVLSALYKRTHLGSKTMPPKMPCHIHIYTYWHPICTLDTFLHLVFEFPVSFWPPLQWLNFLLTALRKPLQVQFNRDHPPASMSQFMAARCGL